MADYAAKATDKAIKSLERRIRAVYTQAQKDIEDKTKDFWRRHKIKDSIYQQQLRDGKITEEDYQAWLRGQVFQGKQWEAKLQQIQSVLSDANRQALNIINDGRIQVFATNSNWAAYQIEKSVGVNFGFGIYDSSAVTRLLRDEPDLLPAKKLNVSKDKKWNKGNIARQISQSIIQGEKLDDIAKRLRNVTTMNRNQSLTNARTAMTGAQNAGRQESYQRAKTMGIKVKKKWLATLDGHTRTNHRKLDGQTVDIDEPFRIGGYTIRYPGDSRAKPEMVYNCRCTMISEVVDYPSENTQRRDNVTGQPIKDMTYTQWMNAKSGAVEEVAEKAAEKAVEKVVSRETFDIPDRIRKSVNAEQASEDWFEYENANMMREYIRTGEMPTEDLYGSEVDNETRYTLAAEAELMQKKGSTTKTKYRTLYRGMVMDEEDVRSAFTPGETYRFDTLSATATDRGVASIYMNPENMGGEGVPVILEIQKSDGIYGFDRDGTEVVVPKGSEFRVTRNYMDENGVVHVSLYAKKGKNVVVE